MDYRSIDYQELEPKQIYFQLIAAISPRPIAWLASRSKEGVDNLAPFSFFNAFSANPPILGFCPGTKADGSEKDSLRNLLETKEAVVNMPNEKMLAAIKTSAEAHAPEISEIEIAGLKSKKADLVNAQRIIGCPFQLEVKLLELIRFRKNSDEVILQHQNFQQAEEQSFCFSDKEAESGIGNLAICQILKIHIDKALIGDDERIKAEEAKLIGRAGADLYTKAEFIR